MTSIAFSPNEFEPQAVRPARRPSAFHTHLREVTRSSHDDVDALFGQFDLTERKPYGAFLTAHAIALVPVEDWADIGRLVSG